MYYSLSNVDYMLEHFSILHKATTPVLDRPNLRKQLAINIEVHLHKMCRCYVLG